jgi:hypothetical protein
MGYSSLKLYYETCFTMVQNNGWSLKDFESLVPWEREIYMGMLSNQMEEEIERLKEQQSKK